MTASVKTKPDAEPKVETEPEPSPNGEKPQSEVPPYGGAPTWEFQPTSEAAVKKVGTDPIVLPSAAVLWEEIDDVGATEFLWEIKLLNEDYQTFAFLDRASVPRHIQRRIVRLPQGDRRELLRRWFKEVTTPVSEVLPPES